MIVLGGDQLALDTAQELCLLQGHRVIAVGYDPSGAAGILQRSA
jgi:hypothetical protein